MPIGDCIETGAVIEIEEYHQTFVGDLFKVGNVFVFHFKSDSFNQALAFDFPRPKTHSAYLGDGFLDKEKGLLVIEFHNLTSL
jgi:hypothetical protein